jgi:PIN domain nuclease of toxin-antitoxin system
MNVLLDTHALIWFAEGSDKLSLTATSEIDNKNNNKFISIATLWEIVIKSSKEKLELKQSFAELNYFLSINNIQIINLEINHLNTLLKLPHYHGDPFDRLLISQAISEDLTIISVDKHFENYPVKVIW